MIVAVLTLYALICTILLVYSGVEFTLLLSYIFGKKVKKASELSELPKVTVQLPMYNEQFVAERLIDHVVKLDYPKNLLEIQVLDDSTDETCTIAQKKVEEYAQQGIDIVYIHRTDRSGFKAGALDFGLKQAKGEFIAVFDADFIPDPAFLQKMLPYFSNEKVGVVQSRWTYLNEDYSFLTRIQTVMLNTHFSVEQEGRNKSSAFINFNGTAGIWRKDCILDAGGWQADTLTEDLDLSFRAQMKGWKFQYLYDVESPSELPITLPGYKAQQFRWSKGAAECVRKNAAALWKSNESFWEKIVGSFHLLNSSVYLIVLCFIVLCWPVSEIIQGLPKGHFFLQILPVFFVPNILLFLVFVGGNLRQLLKNPLRLILFPFTFLGFLSINMGISLYMSIGVLEGYAGKKSEFVRTPKFNVFGTKKVANAYQKNKLSYVNWLELLVFIYGMFLIAKMAVDRNYYVLIFAILFTFGFAYNVFSVLGQTLVKSDSK